MKEYLISVIWVSIIVGICELIAPHSESIKKNLKMIGALCVVCVVITPILSITQLSGEAAEDLKNEILENQTEDLTSEYESIFENYLTNFSEDAVKSSIEELLDKRFEVPREESDVVIFTETTNNTRKLVKVQILLSGGSIFKNPYNIEEYFSELCGCNCEVLIN